MVPKHHDGGICTVRCTGGGWGGGGGVAVAVWLGPITPPPAVARVYPPQPRAPSPVTTLSPGPVASFPRHTPVAMPTKYRIGRLWPHGETPRSDTMTLHLPARQPRPVPITVAPRRLVTRIWLAEWTDGSAHASAPTRLRWEYDRVRSLQSANVSGRAGRRVLPARFYLRHHCMALGHR